MVEEDKPRTEIFDIVDFRGDYERYTKYLKRIIMSYEHFMSDNNLFHKDYLKWCQKQKDMHNIKCSRPDGCYSEYGTMLCNLGCDCKCHTDR